MMKFKEAKEIFKKAEVKVISGCGVTTAEYKAAVSFVSALLEIMDELEPKHYERQERGNEDEGCM